MSGGVKTQKSVLDGHFMERGSFLVAKERVWNPDLSPAVVTETKLFRSAVAWFEDKSRVSPRLTQVHADRVVLQYKWPVSVQSVTAVVSCWCDVISSVPLTRDKRFLPRDAAMLVWSGES